MQAQRPGEQEGPRRLQTAVRRTRVAEEQVRIERVRKHGEIARQEAGILRREKELIATVLRSAEVDDNGSETLAAAVQQQQVDTGRAEDGEVARTGGRRKSGRAAPPKPNFCAPRRSRGQGHARQGGTHGTSITTRPRSSIHR